MSSASSSTPQPNTSDAQAPTQSKENNPAAKLEEDDEFEDFPSEGISIDPDCAHVADGCAADWTEENTDLMAGNTHLWEESWDDDDTNDDFSAQLKEELKKVDAAGKKS